MRTKTILSALFAVSAIFAASVVHADEPEKSELPPIKKEQGTNDPIGNDGFYASGYYLQGDEILLRARSAREYVLLIPLSGPEAMTCIIDAWIN